MVARRKASEPHTNRLLGLLSARDYQRLRPHLHRIPLEYRQSLHRANKPIEFVYFVGTGVVVQAGTAILSSVEWYGRRDAWTQTRQFRNEISKWQYGRYAAGR